MTRFDEIEKARKTLKLGKTATLQEIKETYKALVKTYHPDKYRKEGGETEEKMKEINKAYKIIREYVDGYEFRFTEEDVRRRYPDEQIEIMYTEDWMWGTGKKERRNEDESC